LVVSDRIEQDEPLDERARALAEEFNRPPEVPRDRIWAAIQASRANRSAEVLPFRPRTRPAVPRWAVWVAGVAALITVGIGIGRFTAGTPGGAAAPTNLAVTTATPERQRVALGVATDQYLTRVETMLTSFRLSQSDSQFVGLSRELLTSTRLLLSSHAADDPKTRGLLQDLELILVQIVQLGPADGLQERQLVTDGLEQLQVIPRIRTAISRPLGAS
jgi:hypothetical protein